jgi:16S rRNA (cytosine967-C5)-methyltransferase
LTDAFKQGFFEVQDANSQLVAAFLDVKTGMRVDTCAGAGGKTLHIALMENKGQLIAMDLYESKLKQKIRAKRDGAFNEYRIIDSTK